MILPLASYACLSCTNSWAQKVAMPGEPGWPGAVCPKCGHLYLRWVNFAEFAR